MGKDLFSDMSKNQHNRDLPLWEVNHAELITYNKHLAGHSGICNQKKLSSYRQEASRLVRTMFRYSEA